MSGYPTRVSRGAFGPKPKNRYPVTNPEQQVDGPTVGDLLFWQVAGSNATSDRAWAVLSAAAALMSHGEAWDPDRTTPGPTCTRTGAGVYQLVYAATYNDKDGQPVAPALIAAKAHPQANTDLRAVAIVQPDQRTVIVSIFNAGGAATDSIVLVEVK